MRALARVIGFALALGVASAVLLATRSAGAEVQRFAVIVGSNQGRGGDAPLRYAENDATKVYTVLRDLGGFRPANMVLLKNESPQEFRSTLITINDRIRSVSALPGTDTLLFVYYSGHADASALHLGSQPLPIAELSQLVRGSAAKFRLLVVDACRSGALTRVKGGRIVPAFAIARENSLPGEGLAFLTASSANEDAQESDEIKGSFFTHALVSGLMGAADRDKNGAVVLEEAYRHAYDATVRASSRTFAGMQHPTFQYDFRGQDALVLTRLGAGTATRSILIFPKEIGFLAMRDSAEGEVVAEVGLRDAARSLSLRPGRYFIRGRARDALLEGVITLQAGAAHTIDPGTMKRVEYARLVRKGEGTRAFVNGAELGAAARTKLPNAETPCIGAVLGYRFELEQLGFLARLGACTSSAENSTLSATTNEYDLTLVAQHAWDLPAVTLGLGLGGGAALVTQSFETRGVAPGRTGSSPMALIAGSASMEVGAGFYAASELRGETHFISLQRTSRTGPELEVAFAVRGSLALGHYF
jgi:hypothetical protein